MQKNCTNICFTLPLPAHQSLVSRNVSGRAIRQHSNAALAEIFREVAGACVEYENNKGLNRKLRRQACDRMVGSNSTTLRWLIIGAS